MKYIAALYEYDPENPAIADNRPAHREFINGLNAEGKILGSGPFPDAKGGALIVLQFTDETATIEDAAATMDNDPFFASGAVTARDFASGIQSSTRLASS